MTRAARAKLELHRLLELLSPVDRRVIAQLWSAASPEPAALLEVMRDPQRVRELWERLAPAEQQALSRVLGDGGALPVAIMHREFGAVREPSGFEHPRAYLQALQGPTTPTERLYNLGLIFRAHDERGAIYRVPSDLVPLLPAVPPRDRTLKLQALADPLRPSRPPVPAQQLETLAVTLLTLANAGQLKVLDDGALNKASLARVAKQLDWSIDLRAVRREHEWPFVALTRMMLVESGVLRRTVGGAATGGSAARHEGELRPTPQALDWLNATQPERIRRLLNAWCGSASDDLSILCGLRWKGGAPYTLNRTAARRNLLALVATMPPERWVRLDELVLQIQQVEPDFLRRDGRYGIWLLYNSADQLVSSWQDWPLVEGKLIEAVAGDLLHWLGLTEVEHTANHDVLVRLSALGAHILADGPTPPQALPTPLIVQSTFEVLCAASASLVARFQLGRVAELKQSGPLAIYVLTRPALLAAIERGISATDVVRFLGEHSGGTVPPAVAYTLLEWGGQADQIRLEHAVLLQAADPVVLAQVRAAKGVNLSTAEQLTPTLLRVPEGAADELAERLRRGGFGVRDNRIDPQHPLDERDLQALVLAAFAYARGCAELGLHCELTPAALQRFAKLVPPRWVETAQQAASAFAKQLDPGAQISPGDK